MSRVVVERLSFIDVNELNHLGAFSGAPMEFPFMSVKTWRYLMLYHPPNWPVHVCLPPALHQAL
jgi:hypothetical protein